MEYLVDGGGSRAIHDAIHPVLAEIRALLGADLGVVVYQPVRDGGPPVVLASTDAEGRGHFLPNEPVVADRELPRRAPAALDRLAIRSRLRPQGVRLARSLAVPWRDAFGRGTVVVGNVVTPLPGAETLTEEPLLDEQLRHVRRSVGRALGRARRAGSLQLGNELRRATRAMADAAASDDDPAAALGAVVTSAREVFRSEVAYLAVPDGTSGAFVFDQVLGIRTSSFRCLRVGHGQGLGGLARRTRRPVRSADYESDARLEAAPVDETRHEGIVSAMAAPVTVGGDIAAVLYVGDRRMRAFTTMDEDLLEELAGHASPAVRRRHVETDRARALEQAVRERVAYDLHDSVVRGLVAIGFETEQARHDLPHADGATPRLDTIARVAESCLGRLRGELGLLVSTPPGAPTTPASEVLDRIALVPGRGVGRGLELDGDDLPLVAPAAEALVRVGQEAVANAEQHSGCTRLVVRVTTDPRVVGPLTVGLDVTDDGTFDAAACEGTVTHLGVPAMRAAVAGVGGRLEVAPAEPAGTRVRALVPLHHRPGGTTP